MYLLLLFSYVAFFEGYRPMVARPYEFAKGDVVETFNGVLPWSESMYRMNKKSVLLLSHCFKTPSELHIMLQKYNKPQRKQQADNEN